jgi:hypothetical protein
MRRTPRFTAQSNWDATVFWRMGIRLRLWICITLIHKKFDLWLERARASLVASFANSALPWGKIDKGYVFDGHDECRLPLSRPGAAGTPRTGAGVSDGPAAAARSIYACAGHRRLLPDIIHICARR